MSKSRYTEVQMVGKRPLTSPSADPVWPSISRLRIDEERVDGELSGACAAMA